MRATLKRHFCYHCLQKICCKVTENFFLGWNFVDLRVIAMLGSAWRGPQGGSPGRPPWRNRRRTARRSWPHRRAVTARLGRTEYQPSQYLGWWACLAKACLAKPFTSSPSPAFLPTGHGSIYSQNIPLFHLKRFYFTELKIVYFNRKNPLSLP